MGVARTLSLTVFLAAIWLLLSGHYTPLLLAFGLGSVVGVVLIARRMDVIDQEGHPVHLTWRVPLYWLWLIWQIVVSNLAVARLVIAPKLALSPRLIEVETPQSNDVGRVTFANSITLTPGTVSMRFEAENRILVHALTADIAADLETGAMARRTKDLAG